VLRVALIMEPASAEVLSNKRPYGKAETNESVKMS